MNMKTEKGAFIFARLLDPKPEHLSDPRLQELILPYPGLLLGHNVLTPGFATLAARLFLNNTEPLGGLLYCGIGSGDSGWNPLEQPPAAVGDETDMIAEFARKPWSNKYFVDSDAVPATVAEAIAQNLNTVDFEVVFAESEGVGSIMEIGIWGGDATATLGSGTLCDYETIGLITKPANARLSFVFRWSF